VTNRAQSACRTLRPPASASEFTSFEPSTSLLKWRGRIWPVPTHSWSTGGPQIRAQTVLRVGELAFQVFSGHFLVSKTGVPVPPGKTSPSLHGRYFPVNGQPSDSLPSIRPIPRFRRQIHWNIDASDHPQIVFSILSIGNGSPELNILDPGTSRAADLPGSEVWPRGFRSFRVRSRPFWTRHGPEFMVFQRPLDESRDNGCSKLGAPVPPGRTATACID
jgi:hypothetical protein